jgi:intracellular sulfur oxidation DsrE/DsrF family protein
MISQTIRKIVVISIIAIGSTDAIRAGDRPTGVPLKVVVHVNVPESGVQGAGLKNIANILKGAPDTQVEVVCHGAGIGLVEKARTDHAGAIEALVKQGVKFVACENTMRQKSIRKEDLLPDIGTVPSGAVEVVRKQQHDGYAYFKP